MVTVRAAAGIAVLVLCAGGTGSAAAESMPRGGEHEVVMGTAGADALRGGRGDDRLVGRQGSDRLSGGAGRDRLEAGPGRDTLRGGRGGDTLIPGVDDRTDRIIAGPGDDIGAAIRTDQVSMGSGRDYVLVARSRPGMAIDCGAGEDTVSFQGPPPPELVVEGCEEVVVI